MIAEYEYLKPGNIRAFLFYKRMKQCKRNSNSSVKIERSDGTGSAKALKRAKTTAIDIDWNNYTLLTKGLEDVGIHKAFSW